MKIKDNPLVSIVMPLYNGEEYLHEAIASVIYQTYENIELVIVNDGSKDRSEEIVRSFAKNDSRIKLINQENTGIVGALNNGVAQAKGSLIARMDADDISFLDRIKQQVEAFNSNPSAVLVCSGFEIIDEKSQFMYREILPTRNSEIKRGLLLYNLIAHGSVMFKKDAFNAVGGYSDKCGPTEDYELWGRLATQGDFLAIEQALYRWRKNLNGITHTKNKAMIEYTKKNIQAFWEKNPPSFVSRKEILEIGNYYLNHSRQYGVDMKNISYSNIAQMSVQKIRRGNIRDGVTQLIVLCSTGRTGIKWTFKRFATVINARLFNKEG